MNDEIFQELLKKRLVILTGTNRKQIVSLTARLTQKQFVNKIEYPEHFLFPTEQVDWVNRFASDYNKLNHRNFIIWTNSPYILSQFNNLILAGQLAQKDKGEEVSEKILEEYWLNIDEIEVYLCNDSVESIIDKELGLIAIERIDEASKIVNELFDYLVNLDD